jgi:hypothetical protein
MQHNHQTLLAMLHCPYKAWQIAQETSTPDSNTPTLPPKPTVNDKAALAAWYIQHPDEVPTERDQKACSSYAKQGRALLTTTETLLSRPEAPPFFKIAHCSECQYKNSCYQKLKGRDCISLLAGMTPKALGKYHKKGITTITQLSHLFRPRRRSRSLHVTGRYLYELKALAIREHKTFVLQTPDVPTSPTVIFLDFEGLPDTKFNYLLGGIIVSDDQVQGRFSFWSDNEEQEMDCFIQLLNLFSQYPDGIIYHYGSYETKALKAVVRLLGGEFAREWPSIEGRMVNLLSYLRTHVYPPTYGNGLKEVGSFLGFQWSDPEAGGFHSISWRNQWEETHADSLKAKLIQYNLDDCEALRRAHQWLRQLAAGAEQENVQQVSSMKRQSPYHWQNNDFYGEDFSIINRAAYFNYQRDKIYWRNEPKKYSPKAQSLSRKPAGTKGGVMGWQPKTVNEIITAPPLKTCRRCGSRRMWVCKNVSSLKQTDLKFTTSGIRQHVIEYRTSFSECKDCDCRTNNRSLRMIRYGDNLFAFAVNCYVNYRLSNEMISRLIQEQFGIWISPMYLVMTKYKWWKRNWSVEAEYLRQLVLKSPVIHIDETSIKLSKESGYVWVCATAHSVFYHYTSTRSIDWLNDLLKGYEGIIISDFFPGYETLQVKRQKCLVHLIRDLNDELFKNPFDDEYRVMVSDFSKLLRGIIETIDKYGLLRVKLEKHVADVESYYRQHIDCNHKSELSIKCAKRLKKHWDQLWTFLHHDNITWNNNNAEAAVKAFAQHRRGVNGVMHVRGLREYLQMLSLAQTCRYRNISFLRLLRKKSGLWENLPHDALPGYLPFSQARLFVRKLGFERKRQWVEWSKESRPSFIPCNPHLVYKNKGWTSWHDWIGFSYLPFEKARTYMRKLHLTNRDEFLKWSSSGKRPKSIPADPHKIYKHTGWIDMGDWLGTGNKGQQKTKKLSYQEAKAYVQAIGLKTQHEFFKWRKSGDRPSTIPSAPNMSYVEFEGWGKFLGTDRVANQNMEFWDYEHAKAFLKSLQIRSNIHYRELYKLGVIPTQIPRNPEAYYKKRNSWISFRDFCGRGSENESSNEFAIVENAAISL